VDPASHEENRPVPGIAQSALLRCKVDRDSPPLDDLERIVFGVLLSPGNVINSDEATSRGKGEALAKQIGRASGDMAKTSAERTAAYQTRQRNSGFEILDGEGKPLVDAY
jgi:hypothetical protein